MVESAYIPVPTPVPEKAGFDEVILTLKLHCRRYSVRMAAMEGKKKIEFESYGISYGFNTKMFLQCSGICDQPWTKTWPTPKDEIIVGAVRNKCNPLSMVTMESKCIVNMQEPSVAMNLIVLMFSDEFRMKKLTISTSKWLMDTLDPYHGRYYTAKNAQVVPGWWEQASTMLCCTPWTLLSTMLLHLVMLNNVRHVVDNIVHGVQHNIVQACSHQPGTGWAFLRV